jgi:sugar lactone lactonase YvrE/enterochelin esterase-like enzyme
MRFALPAVSHVLVSSALAVAFGLGVAVPCGAAEEYALGPDSQVPGPGIPRGEVTKHTWSASAVFPGTTRDYWVYVPKQYDPKVPAAVMVFQDGGGYVREDGAWRVPFVFDHLIHRKEMPVTIGVFVNPGVVPALDEGALPRNNRSYEYDGLGDRYARFLLDEILPEVGKRYRLVQDGNGRAIAGASSGAIAAFTVAWERPQAFSRVFSTIGTYVGLRGGHAYPTLVRKGERRPIRVFLQDGSNDLDNDFGHWFTANQAMLAALQYAGYDVKHVWGDGAHDGKHGGAILPDALRWLWRDYPAPVAFAGPSKQTVAKLVDEAAAWQRVGGDYGFTEGPSVNAQGEVFFTDIPANRIHRIGPDGTVAVFKEDAGSPNGMTFGPGGKLFVCQAARRRIVAYDPAGAETIVADDLDCNDLVVSHKGDLWVTDPKHRQVWLVPAQGAKRVVDTGIREPNGLALSPDQTFLMVADTQGQFVWSFQVQADGALAYKEPYCHLHLVEGSTQSNADGVKVDAEGRVYVATQAGVQVCDPLGRVVAIVRSPHPAWMSNLVLGGPGLDELYLTFRDRVYKRKVKANGVRYFEGPVKAAPRRP